MRLQRGFIGLPILLTIVLGLVVIGGGMYFIVQQNSPSKTVTDLGNLNTLPTTNNQIQQPAGNTPTNADPADSSSLPLKTYTNAKWGYSIKYPTDWSVGKEEIILDSVNKIPSTVALS